MNETKSIFQGISISFVAMFISGIRQNDGDINMALMYVLVSALPLIFLNIINGILLFLARNKTQNIRTLLFSIFPCLFILLLILWDSFFGTIGLITFGITNGIAYFKQK